MGRCNIDEHMLRLIDMISMLPWCSGKVGSLATAKSLGTGWQIKHGMRNLASTLSLQKGIQKSQNNLCCAEFILDTNSPHKHAGAHPHSNGKRDLTKPFSAMTARPRVSLKAAM